MRESTDTPSAESRWPRPEEAERLLPELALVALGLELPAAEDLVHLGDVEQMLFRADAVPALVSAPGYRPYDKRARSGPMYPTPEPRYGWAGCPGVVLGGGARGGTPREGKTGGGR